MNTPGSIDVSGPSSQSVPRRRMRRFFSMIVCRTRGKGEEHTVGQLTSLPESLSFRPIDGVANSVSSRTAGKPRSAESLTSQQRSLWSRHSQERTRSQIDLDALQSATTTTTTAPPDTDGKMRDKLNRHRTINRIRFSIARNNPKSIQRLSMDLGVFGRRGQKAEQPVAPYISMKDSMDESQVWSSDVRTDSKTLWRSASLANTLRSYATTNPEESNDTESLSIPAVLSSPVVPPRITTLRVRGSRESANGNANDSPLPSQLERKALLGVPTPSHRSTTSLASSAAEVSSSSLSSLDEPHRPAPSPVGTFGQRDGWWAKGRRSVGTSSGGPSAASLGASSSALDKTPRTRLCSLRASSASSAGASRRASCSSVPGDRIPDGATCSTNLLLARRPLGTQTGRPHSVALPVSFSTGHCGRMMLRRSKRRAVTSWHA